jgi:Tol biopolymer transport system component
MVSRKVLSAAGLVAAFGLAANALGAPALAAAQNAARVSVASDGGQGDGPSFFGAVSANGRFLVFSSDATNLVPGDSNGKTDVFRRDLKTGETIRISVNDQGQEGNGRSFASGVSRDGRLVLFWSHATNLVPGDTNAFEDVFLRDVQLGTTTRLSLAPGGIQTDGGNRFPTMSDDGRFIAFESFATNLVPFDFNGRTDVYLLDRSTGQIKRVGQPSEGESNGDSLRPMITPNGRFLSFESSASNLVPGDTNGTIDAFMLDLTQGTLVRASVSDAGIEGDQQSRGPTVSNNGRWVLFTSLADNLVPGDTNQVFDVFIRDLRRGTTRLVSVSSNGSEGDSGAVRGATLDPRGRFLAFGSFASNMVAGDTNGFSDVFLRDLVRGTTIRLTKGIEGDEANGDSSAAAFVGRSVLVQSTASNLVAGDTNATDDLFLLPWKQAPRTPGPLPGDVAD